MEINIPGTSSTWAFGISITSIKTFPKVGKSRPFSTISIT
jgi:hypothetical protein